MRSCMHTGGDKQTHVPDFPCDAGPRIREGTVEDCWMVPALGRVSELRVSCWNDIEAANSFWCLAQIQY